MHERAFYIHHSFDQPLHITRWICISPKVPKPRWRVILRFCTLLLNECSVYSIAEVFAHVDEMRLTSVKWLWLGGARKRYRNHSYVMTKAHNHAHINAFSRCVPSVFVHRLYHPIHIVESANTGEFEYCLLYAKRSAWRLCEWEATEGWVECCWILTL